MQAIIPQLSHNKEIFEGWKFLSICGGEEEFSDPIDTTQYPSFNSG